MKTVILFLIRFYQVAISPFLGRNCRYMPTCSEYTKICFETHSLPNALLLSTKRICKCHPFSSGGYDPVPAKKSKPNET